MLKSMTGFGTSSVEFPSGVMLCCHIKTLNHKYLNISITLPDELKLYESQIMKVLKDRFKRGSIVVSFYIESNHSNRGELDIDYEKAKNYYNLLLNLKKKYNLKGDVDIALLSSFKEIFIKNDIEQFSDKQILEFLKTVLESSIDKVEIMRVEEGKAIYNDFKIRLKKLKEYLKLIEESAENNTLLAREKLKEKLNSIKKEIDVDKNRLEQEVLLLAVKSDITEEYTRLESHISQLFASFEIEEPVGKRLNFLLQEMTREVNTLCAKASDNNIGEKGILIKEEIEHLKEQGYNIE